VLVRLKTGDVNPPAISVQLRRELPSSSEIVPFTLLYDENVQPGI
jgi:hypothetical protein